MDPFFKKFVQSQTETLSVRQRFFERNYLCRKRKGSESELKTLKNT